MLALSKSKKKMIRSLAMKKIRQTEKLFMAEGDKMVRDLMAHQMGRTKARYRIESVIATDDWLAGNSDRLGQDYDIFRTTQAELQEISQQQTPNQVMAVVRQHIPEEFETSQVKTKLSIGLEYLQDPGNLGTIIRLADWFGIRNILCSENCVDLYNPKTVQATMGSFLRVNVYYCDLPPIISSLRQEKEYMVYGTGQNGSNLFHTPLFLPGIILFGNESTGLSPDIMDLADRILTIPYHDRTSHPDSLNVATAAAILCAEFRKANAK
jgi:TrmH family RNA methyltransferase